MPKNRVRWKEVTPSGADVAVGSTVEMIHIGVGGVLIWNDQEGNTLTLTVSSGDQLPGDNFVTIVDTGTTADDIFAVSGLGWFR